MAANRLIVAGFELSSRRDTNYNRPVIVVFDDAGHVLSSITTPDFYYPLSLAISRQGRVVAGMASRYGPDLFEIRQFHSDGWRMPTVYHHQGAKVGALRFDSTGALYVSGEPVNDAGHVWDAIAGDTWPRTGYTTTRKFDVAGTEVLRVDNGGMGMLGARLCVDNDDNLLFSVGGNGGVNKGVRKYDGVTGALLWEWTYPWTSYPWGFVSVATDSANNVYALGRTENSSNEYCIYKLNSAGVLLATSAAIANIDRNGYFAFGADGVLHCINSRYLRIATDLTVLSDIDLPDYSRAVGPGIMSGDGGLYVGYPAPSGFISFVTFYQLMRVNPADGSIVWGHENFWPLPKTIDGFWGGCTCLALVDDAEVPALKIPLGFATPTLIGDLYSKAPGIAIPLALGAPSTISDYVGLVPVQQVYRAILTGAAGPIELPLVSFSCRRTAGNLSISLVCGAASLEQIEQIDARRNGDIVIYRGFRLPDGREQLNEMLRAPFFSVRWDRRARNASLSIDARKSDEAANPKTRMLKGISYRSAQNGARRVRCEVDTYLCPGDTADLGGGETLIANAISYSVSTDNGTMEVSEAEP